MNVEKSKDTKDTKKQILASAGELFSKVGFEGTSIRSIANAADVNLAAINYHFQNKQNLYFEVIKDNKSILNERISEMAKELESKGVLNTKTLFLETFRILLQEGEALINAFKIYLNCSIQLDDTTSELADFSPPGFEIFYKVISKELGKEIEDGRIMWIIRCGFSHIVHTSIMLQTAIFKNCGNSANIPCAHGDVEKTVSDLIDALIEYSTSNKSI